MFLGRVWIYHAMVDLVNDKYVLRRNSNAYDYEIVFHDSQQIHWCRRRGCRRCKRTPKTHDLVKIRTKWLKICGNLGIMCENLCKIAACALILQKWHPKSKCRRFFNFVLEVIFYLVLFGQVWGKFGQKWCLKFFDLKKCTLHGKKAGIEMESFFLFWRPSSLEFFSGKFGETWAKTLRTPKTLPAFTPMIRAT